MKTAQALSYSLMDTRKPCNPFPMIPLCLSSQDFLLTPLLMFSCMWLKEWQKDTNFSKMVLNLSPNYH